MVAWLPVTASVLAVSALVSGGTAPTSVTAPAPAALTVSAETQLAEEGPTLMDQKVYVLKYHADWCPKCKSLNPVYDAMTKKFKGKPVSFVKLDVTNEETTKRSDAKMKALGLEDIWEKNSGRNGFLMLVDAETKKSVTTLASGTTKEKAADAIESALGS